MKTKMLAMLAVALLSGNLTFAANNHAATLNDYSNLYNHLVEYGNVEMTDVNVNVYNEIRELIDSLGFILSEDAMIKKFPTRAFYNDYKYLNSIYYTSNGWEKCLVERGANGATSSGVRTPALKSAANSPWYCKFINDTYVYVMFNAPLRKDSKITGLYIYVDNNNDEFIKNVRIASNERSLRYLANLYTSNYDNFNNHMQLLVNDGGSLLLADIMAAILEHDGKYSELEEYIKNFIINRIESDSSLASRILQLSHKSQPLLYGCSDVLEAARNKAPFTATVLDIINDKQPINDVALRAKANDDEAIDILIECAKYGIFIDIEEVNNLDDINKIEILKAYAKGGNDDAIFSLYDLSKNDQSLFVDFRNILLDLAARYKVVNESIPRFWFDTQSSNRTLYYIALDDYRVLDTLLDCADITDNKWLKENMLHILQTKTGKSIEQLRQYCYQKTQETYAKAKDRLDALKSVNLKPVKIALDDDIDRKYDLERKAAQAALEDSILDVEDEMSRLDE